MKIEFQKLQQLLNDEIAFTPEDIALLFCNMGSHDMAEFFNYVSSISDNWHEGFSMQMEYVRQSKLLESSGKMIMSLIGEYSK